MSNKTKFTSTKENCRTPLVPKLRFPEFRDAEGWDAEPMRELFSFKGNNSLSREKLNYERGSVKNIHYGDIHTNFSSHFNIQKERVPYINPSELTGAVKAENFCVEGDLIFADASEDLEDIGKAIEIVKLNGEAVVSGLHTILARQIKSKLVLGFGGHLFKSSRVRIQIQKESQGAKVLGLSGGRLSKVEIPFPHSPLEQRKIADCLSSLDDLIAAQARKVEALKTHKNGLMQQLFPREGETQPRLRFPKFRNGGEWQKRKISALLTKSVRPVNVDLDATYREVGIRSHGKGIFHKKPISGKAIGDKRVFWAAEEALVLNIVFAWEQAVAVTSLAEKGMIASHRFPMYSARPNEAHVHFIKYFFLS